MKSQFYSDTHYRRIADQHPNETAAQIATRKRENEIRSEINAEADKLFGVPKTIAELEKWREYVSAEIWKRVVHHKA